MNHVRIQNITLVGLMTAVTAVLAQIAIPTPWGISFTLQTFVTSLAGYLLGPWLGLLTVFLYLCLGLIGLPVFTGFGSGPGILTGITGGYLFGFLPLALCCGFAVRPSKKIRKNEKSPAIRLLVLCLSSLGLVICHLTGVLQFSYVSSMTLWRAFCIGSLPYLVKDVLSLFFAYYLSGLLRKQLPLT